MDRGHTVDSGFVLIHPPTIPYSFIMKPVQIYGRRLEGPILDKAHPHRKTVTHGAYKVAILTTTLQRRAQGTET
jgi:hypothetical protein